MLTCTARLRTPIGMAPRDKELHASDLKSLWSVGHMLGNHQLHIR